jgi:hypothetical protein
MRLVPPDILPSVAAAIATLFFAAPAGARPGDGEIRPVSSSQSKVTSVFVVRNQAILSGRHLAHQTTSPMIAVQYGTGARGQVTLPTEAQEGTLLHRTSSIPSRAHPGLDYHKTVQVLSDGTTRVMRAYVPSSGRGSTHVVIREQILRDGLASGVDAILGTTISTVDRTSLMAATTTAAAAPPVGRDPSQGAIRPLPARRSTGTVMNIVRFATNVHRTGSFQNGPTSVQSAIRFGSGIRGHVELPTDVLAEPLQSIVSRIPSKHYPGMNRVRTLVVQADGKRLVARTLEPATGTGGSSHQIITGGFNATPESPTLQGVLHTSSTTVVRTSLGDQ